MKMNKKGFTLIELLAVIVILAIIALIATPIILGIIRDSRQNSAARAVEGYADAVRLAITTLHGRNPEVEIVSADIAPNGAIDISEDAKNGDVVPTNTTQPVIYSGSMVTCGTHAIDQLTGRITLTGCTVAGNTNDSFRFTDDEGATLEP